MVPSAIPENGLICIYFMLYSWFLHHEELGWLYHQLQFAEAPHSHVQREHPHYNGTLLLVCMCIYASLLTEVLSFPWVCFS